MKRAHPRWSLPCKLKLLPASETQKLSLPGGREVSFPVDPFSKSCLLNGVDELGYILRFEAQIAAFEQRTARVPA